MDIHEAIKLLKYHQEWRLGADTEMLDPKTVTEAIEIAINIMTTVTKN